MSEDVTCLSLRVKRRRDAEAAPELILETTSSSRSAGSVPKLSASLRQTLAVSHSHQGASSAAAEVPAKKRCRFVLVPAADSVATPTAAAGAAGHEQGLAGPVLELWHTSAAERSNTAAQHAASGYRRPKPEPDAQERAGVYDAMVQQYLQEQQQQQVPTSTQQQRVRHRPSKLAHCNTSRPQSVPPCQQQAQEQQHQHQHQQGPQLPAYMTAGMLKQYGLWHGLQAQQQQLQGSVSQPDAAAAASTDDSQDMDYAYDMYVAAADPDDGDAGGVASCAGMDASNCQQEGAGLRPGTPDAAADLPVIQVWEDELLQLHENWALGQDVAADADSEDSNAEDFYGNEYPDEEDGSCRDSMDSLDTEDEQEGAVSNRRRSLGSSGIDFYQPGNSSSSRTAGRLAHAHAQDGGAVEGGYGSDGSFDVEDYVSSGDTQGEGRDEDAGPAWLRKHCTAYGADAGGQAWRSVLAQQFAAP